MVALLADERCRATVGGRLRGVATFRSAVTGLSPGSRATVRLRLSTAGARAARGALRRRGSLLVALRIEAVDAAGNIRTLAPTVRVRG